jgi:hypothetical protein
MKRSNLAIFAILLLVFANGCSSSSSNNPTYPQVNYVTGGTEIYYSQTLDKNTGQPTPGSGDTITSVVVETGIAYQGMTGVTAIQNTHTNPGSGIATVDTSYIAQSNGNYYHYNYGLELLNTNQLVLSANGGKPLIAGWVLQAEFSATEGTKWVPVDTPISFSGQTGELSDTVTEANDSSITVGAVQVPTKHAIHALEIASLLVTAKDTAYTYVSSSDGPVLDIFPPATLEQIPTPGRITILIKAK